MSLWPELYPVTLPQAGKEGKWGGGSGKKCCTVLAETQQKIGQVG